MDISALIGKGLAETILSLRVNKGSICHIILVTSLFKEPKTIGSTKVTKILPAGLEDWFVHNDLNPACFCSNCLWEKNKRYGRNLMLFKGDTFVVVNFGKKKN